jgi:hypothetical protein
MSDAKSVVCRVIDRAWNNGDFELLDTVAAAIYARKLPGGQVGGRDGFKLRIADTSARFPDFRSESMISSEKAEPA